MRFKTVEMDGKTIDPTAVAAKVAQALESAVVVHVRGIAALEQPLLFGERLARALGRPAMADEDSETGVPTESFWTDVRFDPRRRDTFRHGNSAQPLHTDGAYYCEPPNTVMFYCERQAAAGGETIFLDGMDLVDAVQTEAPALYDRLSSAKVGFSKAGRPGPCCSIIDFDRSGPKLTWNYYRVTPGQSVEARDTCDAFFAYLQDRFVERGDVRSVHLQPGELVLFRDERVLHGRGPYTAEALDDRLLWKGSLNFNYLD